LAVEAFELFDMGEEQTRTDITKQEAARRQLETAIALFFCEDDEISVHVLANAAALAHFPS